MPGVVDEISDYFELAKSQAAEFSKTAAEALSEMSEQSLEILDTQVEMTESFQEVKEMIADTTEAIAQKTVIVDEFADSVKNVGNASAGSARGMQQLTQGTTRLLGTFGLLPPEIGKMATGLVQVGRGAQTALPPMAKLAAMIAPITLAATALMGITSIINSFRNSEDDVEALTRGFSQLKNESQRLEDSIAENIDLIARLNAVGASGSLIERFEAENEVLQSMSNALRYLAEISAERAAIERMDELLYRARELELVWGSVYVEAYGGYIRSVVATNEVFSKNIVEQIQYYLNLRDAGYELDEAQQSLIETFMESATVQGGYINTLMAGGDAAQELGREIAALAQQFADASQDVEGKTEAYENYMAAAEQVGRLNRNIGTTLRNLQRASSGYESHLYALSSAHDVLSDAINTMNSGYDLSIDQFSRLMELAPEHIMLLLGQEGALLDVEYATRLLYQAEMELMALNMAQRMYESARAAHEAGIAMVGYAGQIDIATDSMWELVKAQAAFLAGEGGVDLTGQFAQLRNMALSAGRTAAGGGRREAATVSTPRGRATLVSDPANDEIREEIIRMKEDVARANYARAYSRSPIVYQGGNVTINAPIQSAMSRQELEGYTRYLTQSAAAEISEQLKDAITHDLSYSGSDSYGGRFSQ